MKTNTPNRLGIFLRKKTLCLFAPLEIGQKILEKFIMKILKIEIAIHPDLLIAN